MATRGVILDTLYPLPINKDSPPWLSKIRRGLDSGKFSSVDLLGTYFGRMQQLAEYTNAVIQISQQAMQVAVLRDNEREVAKRNNVRLGPLHGIPILLKDNMGTKDDMRTAAGPFALSGAQLDRESTVVTKLRAAGAILLGKGNMSQWDYRSDYSVSEGWSSRGGQTVGGYYPGQSPRGSSSGCAVATSLGLCWAALGTDTSGCITMPADANNVVGIRPTTGLASRHMVVPPSSQPESIGTFTQTVQDGAVLLAAIAGRDELDTLTHIIPFQTVPDYLGACRFSGLRGKRIGIPRQLIQLMVPQFDPHFSMDVFDFSLDIMRHAGAIVVENVDLPGPLAYWRGGSRHPLDYLDFPTDLVDQRLRGLQDNPMSIRCMRDLLKFTREHPREVMTNQWATNMWLDVLHMDGRHVWRDWGLDYLEINLAYGVFGASGAISRHNLQALAMPSVVACSVAPHAGMPVFTIPLGRTEFDAPYKKTRVGELYESGPNRPFGMSFVGRCFDEETLFAISHAFEQRTFARRKIGSYLFPRYEIFHGLHDRAVDEARRQEVAVFEADETEDEDNNEGEQDNDISQAEIQRQEARSREAQAMFHAALALASMGSH